MRPIIRHQLAGARIAVLAAWSTARRPAGYRPGHLFHIEERTSIVFKTIRGIARSLMIPAVFAAMALTGQQAASAAAMPMVHFAAPSHVSHFAAPEVHFAAPEVHFAAPAGRNW